MTLIVHFRPDVIFYSEDFFKVFMIRKRPDQFCYYSFFTAVLLDEENEETADPSRLSQTILWIETADLVSSMGMSSNCRSKQFKGNSSAKSFTRSRNCRPYHLDEVFVCELGILNQWLISDLKLFFILFKEFFEVFIILKRPDQLCYQSQFTALL